MKDDLTLIMRSKLFEGFSKPDCMTIYSLLQPKLKSYIKNEVIVNEGDRLDYIGIVSKGRVTSTKQDYDGNMHLIEILEPPMLFGMEIVTTTSRLSPLAITSASPCSILMFSYDKFMAEEALLDQYRVRMLNNLMHLLANENVKKMYKIEVLSKRALRERIMIYLHLMEMKTGESSFFIDMNREQFAQYLCVNRSALSHELSRMRTEGLISFQKNRFTLHK